jgi:hypothetical protein
VILAVPAGGTGLIGAVHTAFTVRTRRRDA